MDEGVIRRVDAAASRLGRAVRILLTVAVVALILWGLFAAFIQPNVFPKNFATVQAGQVYRSGALTPAATKRVVDRHKVRTIIDLGGFDRDPAADRVAQLTAEALGVTRYQFLLSGDGTGNPNAYVAALRLLADEANHPVLIHCSAGSQRTSACVILYRHVIQDRAFERVYHEAFEHGHNADDNRAMGPYLLDWAPSIERAFREGGWIPGNETFQHQLDAGGVGSRP